MPSYSHLRIRKQTLIAFYFFASIFSQTLARAFDSQSRITIQEPFDQRKEENELKKKERKKRKKETKKTSLYRSAYTLWSLQKIHYIYKQFILIIVIVNIYVHNISSLIY